MSCSNSSELYCSPAQDASLFPDLNYTLSYNPEFEGLNGSSNVDIYLYHADNSALSQHFPNQTNNGNMTYTIDTVLPLKEGG
jgi:hypothetical protein